MLAPDGTLAFAVMTRGTFTELNASRNRIAPHKPSRVIMPTKNEIKKAVTAANLGILRQETAIIRQEFHSVGKMFKQFHDQGLTGGNIPCGNAFLTRSELSRLTADYEKKYRTGHGVYATFRVFYCVIQKKCGD